MKGGKPVVKPFGFTIIEVMIVLAVTIVILASTIVLISGRTQTAAFQQEVNDVQSRLQAIMNDVSTGNYNLPANLSCVTSTISGVVATVSAAPPADTGDCIVLGQAILFTSNNNYYTFEVLGARQDIAGSGVISSTYGQASPTIPPKISELVSSGPLNNELNAQWVDYRTTAGTPLTPVSSPQTDMVAFLSDPSSSGTVSSTSTAIGVNVIPVPDGVTTLPSIPVSVTATSQALSDASTEVNNFPYNANSLAVQGDGTGSAGPIKNPVGGVGICFASPSTNKSVLYTLGGNNRSTTIENQIFDGGSC